MNDIIITAVLEFLSGIFDAAENFIENPGGTAELEKNLGDLGRASVAGVMTGILEELDGFIAESPVTKKDYAPVRKRSRTLITPFGDVTFNRTLYKKKADGSYHMLVDEQIHLPKNEHFSEGAEIVALTEAAKTTYQHAADCLTVNGQTVSKVAVMNKVHGTIEELPMDEPCEKKKCRYLYIEADEDHIHRQKAGPEVKGCMTGKMIYVFEGKEDVCRGRRKLISPVFFGGLYAGSKENARLWKRVQEYISTHYDEKALKQVYISSDGGAWIRTSVNYIDKSALVADRFHLMKYINKLSKLTLDDYEETRGKFYKYIYKNQIRNVQKLLVKIRKSVDDQEAVNDGETFLMNNWEAIQRAFHDKHVPGCSAEGHVSSIYSNRMSSRPMGWSETGADRMCRLRCLVESYGEEKIVDLVRIRRERELGELSATGTDDIAIQKPEVRRRFTKAQLEAASYAERIHASFVSHLAKKEAAIRFHLYD